jgi:hypothetical protein
MESRQYRHRAPIAGRNGVEADAQLLRIGRTRCYQIVTAGRIRIVKIGPSRLVVPAGLVDFVDALEAEQRAS